MDGTTAVETSTAAARAGTPSGGDSYESFAEGILDAEPGTLQHQPGDFGSIVPQHPADAKPETGGQPPAPKAEGETERGAEQQAQPEREEVPQDESTTPKEILAALNAVPDAKARAALRNSYFAERAFREVFPTVKAAKEFAESFPGGLGDVQELASNAGRMATIDRVLTTGSEDEKAGMFADLADMGGADALFGAATAALRTMAERDPQSLDQLIRDLAEVRKLGIAERPSEETAADFLGYQDGEKPNSETERLRAELESLQEQHEAQRLEIAQRQDAQVIYRTAGAVADEIGKLVDGSVGHLSEGARVKISSEIMGAVTQQLRQNQAFTAGLDAARLKGPTEAERFTMAAVRQVLPGAARRVVNEWTGDILKVSKTVGDKKAAVAARADRIAGASGGAARAGGAVKAARPNYSKSDMELLSSE